MSAVGLQATRDAGRGMLVQLGQRVDLGLLLVVAALLALGLVMVASASIGIADRGVGDPFHFLKRQGVYLLAGLAWAYVMFNLRLAWLESAGPWLMLLAFLLLTLVLVPGIGKTVNGSTRWIALGPVNVQVSELAKLALTVYLAGYLVRHGQAVRDTFQGFLVPLLMSFIAALLLLLEPDFGAAAVLMAITLGVLFLGGVRLWQFGLLLLVVLGAMAVLALSSPYRLARLTAFLNPWNDPFNSGFQLTQSLIAIGSGSWFGVGLGGSVQKLFYLPEAHNDFLFAVLAEELGLIGVTVVIVLYAFLFWRCFRIGTAAEAVGHRFGAYLSYGLGLWFGLQACINMGVNMGLLPTKGLTLPLMSYGGSSMMVSCAAVGLLLRVHRETVSIAGIERMRHSLAGIR
ncbi:MAG: putative lipid II flippase FtsW [Chromatiales bacterium]|jgi:cell division protein FtsW|nr:putative lipid II flippase FtsW [Chromatiales bacterium]MDX9767214.1 putative lipid II flippase FtsW [Ectothiorhodospiraceae bacterium]